MSLSKTDRHGLSMLNSGRSERTGDLFQSLAFDELLINARRHKLDHQRRSQVPVPDIALAPPANVRFGSTTDLQCHSHLRPLSGAKRTLNVRFPGQLQFTAGTSEGGGKPDILLSPHFQGPQGLTGAHLTSLTPP